MNAYEFTKNLKNEFGSNLNVIYMNEKGCTLEVHDGRMIKTDLVGKKHKYYTSVDRLMQHSKLFARYANNITVIVMHNGTDCNDSKVVKL